MIVVIDKNGVQGEIDVTAPPPFDGSGSHLLVRLAKGGRRVVVPISALVEREGQGYFLPLSLWELPDAPTLQPQSPPMPEHPVTEQPVSEQTLPEPPLPDDVGGERAGDIGARGSAAAVVVPLVAEELQIERRLVETGRVRITKKVVEREEIVDEPLIREEVDVRRVAVNRQVSEPSPIRYEGETMIVPLFEEVLFVEKRLMLKEELHITRRRVNEPQPQRVTLRSEQAEVKRLQPEPPQDGERTGG